MSDVIDAVIKTRKLSADVATQSLVNIENISEIELHRRILDEMSACDTIFPAGWYEPPQGGVSVLFDIAPFSRLLYGTLRDPEFLPSETHKFTKEAVGSIYFSPVNKTTKTLADIGFTIYRGQNREIKNHLKKTYNIVHKIAERVRIGMRFSDLCIFATELFQTNNLRPSKRVVLNSTQKQSLNLGHSVPGILPNDQIPGNSLEEIKEYIRTKRVSFIDTENFEIPETYAFTVESRLESITDSSMPSASWHFMVCFNKGKKTIIDNFEEIFKVVGMDYMKTK
ncbi:MAG TPA: hypothetical protein VJB95_02980 [Candidatus Paceibacterota bacterium]